MTERPIIFNAEMVRAILDGRKTQTRRVVKPQPPGNTTESMIACDESCDVKFFLKVGYVGISSTNWIKCPYGKVGDLLWVRETHVIIPGNHMDNKTLEEALINGKSSPLVMYPATDRIYKGEKKRPSIHMPRWTSRITLKITDIRVERLQDISEEDALEEGIGGHLSGGYDFDYTEYCQAGANFRRLWESINGKKYPWKDNPWVWVVTFERI